jgi:Glucose / Sorbosone dehydrogenase
MHACAALGLCFGVAACGDDRPGGDPVPIRGGERLGWDQPAASLEALRAHTFKLYIDGSPATLIDPRCTETLTSAGYQCSGGLPSMPAGRHDLAVTSVLNGAESRASAPLVVEVLSSGRVRFISPQSSPLERSDSIAVVCADESPRQECYDVNTIANGLDPVTMLASAPDGRLLFVEGESRVRVVANGALLAEPALTARDPKSRIVGLAIDRNFSESHAVFISSTEPAGNGGSVLSVTRYREVANSLGEGSAIIGALPFSDDALAPMALDREGQLYVALPDASVTTRTVGLDVSFGGAVVRFDRDGRMPRQGPQTSPVLSYGYSRPTFVTVDPTYDRIWIGGTSATMHAASTIDIGAVKNGSLPLMPRTAGTSWPGADPAPVSARDLAFSNNEQEGAGLFASDGQLFLTSSTADGKLIARGKLELGQGAPVRVAGVSTGAWYVAVLTAEGRTAILSLKRRP